MANYASKDIVIEIDNTVGGSLQNMSQYIRELNGVKIAAILQESHAFGDTWFESLSTGIKRMEDLTVRGFYDDLVTVGPNASFIGIGDVRTFKVTWGSTKTTSTESIILSYERIAKVNDLTLYEAVFRPTGTVTEA